MRAGGLIEGNEQVLSGSKRGTASGYRKYRPVPALVLILGLGAISAFVWVKALSSGQEVDEAVKCNPPASPPPGMTYTSVGHAALNDVDPLPPDRVAVRVLNASGARGQAALTTDQLHQLGFTKARKPKNDPAYEGRTAECRGQIRFGENGKAAARTLSLVESCVELIKDSREDASVDLAIGSDFGEVHPRPEAIRAFEHLSAWSQQNSGSGNAEVATKATTPHLDQGLLEAARPTDC